MKIILVTGVFDILHAEHVHFLQAAKNVGGQLIVGIESDVRVKKLKGLNRPLIPQNDRLEIIKNLKSVDKAFILPENFDHEAAYIDLFKEIKADIYAASSSSPHLENKRLVCQKAGVKLEIVYPENPAVSTSKIIEKIKNS